MQITGTLRAEENLPSDWHYKVHLEDALQKNPKALFYILYHYLNHALIWRTLIPSLR